MQTIAYPTALRTAIAAWDLARETGQLSEADYQMDYAQAIANAKKVLIANGSLDASWMDTGPDGATPIPFVDNPEGLTQIFYNGTHL